MGVKLSQLATETSPASDDIIMIADPVTGVAKKITVTALKSLLDTISGGGAGDITAPTVIGAVVNSGTPSVIQVTFSESVPTLTTAGWSFRKNGVSWAISSVSQVTSTVWAFTMTSAASSGDTLLRSYSQSTGNTLDASGNELTGFTDASITNNISGSGDTTAPTVVSRTAVATDKIRVVYSENVNASTAGHTFNVDGSNFTPSSATSFTATTVDYILATSMTSGSTITHSYATQGTGSGTRDSALNQLSAFSSQSVTNSIGSGGSTWTKRAGVVMTSNVGGFWEYKPSTYTPSGTKIPVIIAWHGGGAQGTGSSTDLNLLLNEGVPQQINAQGFSYQAVVICPQYTGGAPTSAMIEGVIDYVIANYNIDTTKLHLTGLSFGGAILGNWAVTGTIEKVASISVLCSFFDVNSTAVSRLKAAGMPIRLYHGTADSVAPVSNSRNWFNSLNAATSIVPATEKYELDGYEHNIWTDVYPSAAVFGGKNWAEWHLEQQRIPLTALTFPTNIGPLNNTSGVLTAGDTGGSGFNLNKGLSNLKLPANTDGFIQMQFVSSAGVGGRCILGFNSANSNDDAINYEAAAYIFDSGGLVYKVEGGAVTSSGYTMTNNHYIRVSRTGSTIKMQRSADAVSWIDILTFTYSSTADLYICAALESSADARMHYPKGYNVA